MFCIVFNFAETCGVWLNLATTTKWILLNILPTGCKQFSLPNSLFSSRLCLISWFAANNQQLFSDTLGKINKELGYLHFDLRACMNQYDGTVYYGVVNTIADEESKLGSKYSVPQIAFYKGLVCNHLLQLAQSVLKWHIVLVAVRSNSSGRWKWWKHNRYWRS